MVGRLTLAFMIAGAMPWSTASAATPSGATACGGSLRETNGKTLLYVEQTAASCPWAFTTDQIVIGCEGEALVAVTEDGRDFALNGTARQRLKLGSIDPIWRARDDLPDVKVDIGPWIDAGQALCR